MNIGHVPSASFYRPNQAPRFGWQALSDIRNNTQQSYYNSRTYYVAGVKPKASFPESAWSKDNLPDPAPTSRTTSISAPEQQSPTTWTEDQATLLGVLRTKATSSMKKILSSNISLGFLTRLKHAHMGHGGRVSLMKPRR